MSWVFLEHPTGDRCDAPSYLQAKMVVQDCKVDATIMVALPRSCQSITLP
jgi:hypothetical protein